MPWVRFDDQYPIHRKISGLSDKAFRLHSSAIFWCSRNGTDGFIPAEDIDDTCPKVRPARRFAAECVRRRVWHVAGEKCASEKCLAYVDNDDQPVDNGPGWVIHDYLDYQPSAQKVTQERRAKAERQKRWIESKQRRQKDASQDDAIDVKKDDAPNPSPPRPEGRRGAGRPAAHANGRASPPGSPARVLEKPPWCGQCNEVTRITDEDTPQRCPRCHPVASLIGQETSP